MKTNHLACEIIIGGKNITPELNRQMDAADAARRYARSFARYARKSGFESLGGGWVRMPSGKKIQSWGAVAGLVADAIARGVRMPARRLASLDELFPPANPAATFRVWCRVSGGVTGTREGFLKSNGDVKTFASHEAASAEAARLNREMNHAYAKAFFSYRVALPGDHGVAFGDAR